ncbi:MAG TPA: winged helix-turn-helix transcriptional regulator [Pyrodictium sp.]|nr:winged helix-turn-helix transcriptional regulator [Pyrodictium sp.]
MDTEVQREVQVDSRVELPYQSQYPPFPSWKACRCCSCWGVIGSSRLLLSHCPRQLPGRDCLSHAVPTSLMGGTMGIDVVLPLLLLSLGVGLGTFGTVLWLKGRIVRLEAEQARLRADQKRVAVELEEKLEKLEAEVAYLRKLLEERSSRLKLLEDKLEALKAENRALRAELGEARDRLRALEDLVLARMGEKAKIEAHEQNLERELLDLKILALYKQGYSIREIAKMVGLSKSTVHRRLKKLLGK